MTIPTARERELERVIEELQIRAVPFATGRGMKAARYLLMQAIKKGNDVLNARPCERDRPKELVDLANAADEERRRDPCYRADLDG